MSNKLILKHNSENSNITDYTPDNSELIFDSKKKQLRVGDGSTPGGIVPSNVVYTPLISNETYTATENSVVLVDCRNNNVTITLPTENLESGAMVKVIDAYYAASSDKQIIISSTDKINNVAESFIIDVPRAYITFIYIKDTANWVVDLGGVILPSYEISTTDELGWNESGQLGINQVSSDKITTPIEIDLGTF